LDQAVFGSVPRTLGIDDRQKVGHALVVLGRRQRDGPAGGGLDAGDYLYFRDASGNVGQLVAGRRPAGAGVNRPSRWPTTIATAPPRRGGRY